MSVAADVEGGFHEGAPDRDSQPDGELIANLGGAALAGGAQEVPDAHKDEPVAREVWRAYFARDLGSRAVNGRPGSMPRHVSSPPHTGRILAQHWRGSRGNLS